MNPIIYIFYLFKSAGYKRIKLITHMLLSLEKCQEAQMINPKNYF